MEKFSQYRDAATGLAPFVIPRAPEALNPALYAIVGVGWLVGILRVLLIVTIFVVKIILDTLAMPLASVNPSLHASVEAAVSFVICRLALFLLGFYFIGTELSQSLKRGTGRTNLPPEHPQKGDLILANWSSYIELLYLSFRYNPCYLEPIVDSKTKAILGFRRATLLRMVLLCGRPPAETSEVPRDLLSIEKHLESTAVPCCILPELTTTNNRALLPFANLSKTANGLLVPRVYLYAFRHDVPKDLQSSATAPVPSALNPLVHLLQLAACPLLPRRLHVRQLHSTEAPRADLSSERFWLACGEATSQLARLKVIKTLSWKDKAGFVQYYKKSKSL